MPVLALLQLARCARKRVGETVQFVFDRDRMAQRQSSPHIHIFGAKANSSDVGDEPAPGAHHTRVVVQAVPAETRGSVYP